jgi:beta-lactamase regulating signal transducer with metallopeptidase domain
MIPALAPIPVPIPIEAALRAILAALTVWSGLRLFRVSDVVAQKAAWVLVLTAAVAMPVMMRWQGPPACVTLHMPASMPQLAPESSPAAESAPERVLPAIAQPRLTAAPGPTAGDRFQAPMVSSAEADTPARTRRAQVQAEPAQSREGKVAREAGLRLPRVQSAQGQTLQIQSLAGILYLAVLAGLLLRTIYGLAAAVRLWLAAEPVLLELEPGQAAGLRLRCSRGVASPVTIGSGVLMPADYAQWDAEKLRIVLAHERSHVHQGDFYLQLLAGLYAAFFWFSPLGWWLKRKLSDLGEAIGDRAALREAASRASYAHLLLEFAAQPRPTLIGVAMARTSNLSHRIERLLNESIFRQAFSGNRRRILLAILLVPVALFAATAMIRVEAASQAATSQTAKSQDSKQAAPSAAPPAEQLAGQSHPEQASGDAEPQAPAAPPPPLIPAAPAPPDGPGTTAVPEGAPPLPPPLPGSSQDLRIRVTVDPQLKVTADTRDNSATKTVDSQLVVTTDAQDNTVTRTYTYDNKAYAYKSKIYGDNQSKHLMNRLMGQGYELSYSSDGDSWVLITDPNQRVSFSGDWGDALRAALEKVRKLTKGQFLCFTRNGKSYFVDDPGTIAGIEAMYKPMEALGRQQEELGRRQEELGKQQEALGHLMEQARIPAPDISKEMTDVTAAMAKLQAKLGKTVSQEELGVLEGKLAELQGKLGALQGELGAKQGEIGGKMGKLGGMQGELGAEQGKLGAEQGRIAAEADRKVKATIDESLRNGKAKPVE